MSEALLSTGESVLIGSPPGSIWHRRRTSTGTGERNNRKYNYWRAVDPCRDWNTDSNFNVSCPTDDSPMFDVRAGQLLAWLCGEDWQQMEGFSWPCFTNSIRGVDQYGLPEDLRRQT